MAGDFTDLIAWQVAAEVAADVSRLAPRLRGHGAAAVADQVRRAAEAVPANIAEGYGRGLGRDYARYLRMSAGSAAELESHLRISVITGRLRLGEAEAAIAKCRRVRALLHGLERRVATGRRQSDAPQRSRQESAERVEG